MKHLLLFWTLSFLFFSPYALSAQQYMDDTTFVGSWKVIKKPASDDFVLSRSAKQLSSSVAGIVLNRDGSALIQLDAGDGSVASYEANWWSLSIGHFGVQYYDPAKRRDITQAFAYLNANKKAIIRIHYMVSTTTKDVGFAGFWKELPADAAGAVYITRSTSAEEAQPGIELHEDGSAVRRLPSGDGTYRELYGTWWPVEENYFDFQYYDALNKLIVIEGFEIADPKNPNSMKRTRNEQIHD